MLQLQYHKQGEVVLDRTSVGGRGQRTHRGVHVGRLADRADFAVGRAVCPVETAVFELQP